ncbi:MAG: isoprenyl transferase [Flavobacteriaceae bacterium]|nr:isoprenyl transferase [Flavobacteriaceae bacterium]
MTTHTQLIDTTKLPKHIAIIMDGNGRWAKEQGKPRIFGHKHGVASVRETLETAVDLGIEYLTLYAFSTENWNRPKLEVTALMNILVSSLKKEVGRMQQNNVKLNVIGNMDALPSSVRKKLQEVMALTKNNTKITLSLALSYGSREEIVNAIKKISEKVVNNSIKIEEIDEKVINNHLYTFSLPDVDLLIRTSGEQRISNFLLWQIAYSELYFTNVCWPDFKRPHLIEAITTYQNRERRFGKTSEQIEKT